MFLLQCSFFPINTSAKVGALEEFQALGEKFDHITTGYELSGEHARIECGECHYGGVFETLPKQCEACHDNIIASGKPSIHVETSKSCDTCHTTDNFLASAVMDHSVTAGRCVTCHGGVAAEGKTETHPPSTDICDGCHTTDYWIPLSNVDHDQVMSDCIYCHRPGGIAKNSKGTNHMPTSDICEVCHIDVGITWTPVNTVDHGHVLGACSYCHDGVIARGKGPMHIVTNEECNACHISGGAPGLNPWAAN